MGRQSLVLGRGSWGLCEGGGLCHRYFKQGKSSALAQTLGNPLALCINNTLVFRYEGPPPRGPRNVSVTFLQRSIIL